MLQSVIGQFYVATLVFYFALTFYFQPISTTNLSCTLVKSMTLAKVSNNTPYYFTISLYSLHPKKTGPKFGCDQIWMCSVIFQHLFDMAFGTKRLIFTSQNYLSMYHQHMLPDRCSSPPLANTFATRLKLFSSYRTV